MPLDQAPTLGRAHRCCSGGLWDKQWAYIYHEYPRPKPLAALKAAALGVWQPPDLRRPDWCDKLIGIYIEFGTLPYHPCAYWTADYEPEGDRA